MKAEIPDSTAVRVALWRALHLEVDASPAVLRDDIGLKLIAPPVNWRERGDMHPQGTAGYRASIVARARYIEDLVWEQVQKGVGQYVLLGSGLDTFAQRESEKIAQSKLQIFEIDKPDTLAWKQTRLKELAYKNTDGLHFVPVNFENQESWLQKLKASGFASDQPALVTSTGVTMYLSREAIAELLREVAKLAPGSTLALTFMLPLEMIDEPERSQHAAVFERARAAGTPFLSFFKPEEMLELARKCGFKKTAHIATADLTERYFAGRSDGLKPSTGESFLIASV